jgi:hypothetical protein
MGIPRLWHDPDVYVSPGERERMREGRAALRVAFARLAPFERRRQADDFWKRLRPLCMSRQAHEGAWSGMFVPLLSGGEASATAPRLQPRTAAPSTEPGPTSRKQTKKVPPPHQAPPTNPSETIHVSALRALLAQIDEAGLELMRQALGAVMADPPRKPKSAKVGVTTLARELAAELRRRR